MEHVPAEQNSVSEETKDVNVSCDSDTYDFSWICVA